MRKDGNDFPEVVETKGLQMKRQAMDDAETRHGVMIGEATCPEGTEKSKERTPRGQRRQGEKWQSFCEQ
jgi:hypothetical protein